MSFAALLALACVGAGMLVGEIPLIAMTVWLVALGFVATAAVLVVAGPRLVGAHVWPAPVRRALNAAAIEADALRRRPRSLALGSGFAFAIQVCTVAATIMVLRAVGHGISAEMAILTVPLIALLVSLPLSVQGIGVREATYVSLLAVAGVPAETALSAAFVSFLLSIAVSLLGGAIVAVRVLRTAGERAGRRTSSRTPAQGRPDDAEPRAA